MQEVVDTIVVIGQRITLPTFTNFLFELPTHDGFSYEPNEDSIEGSVGVSLSLIPVCGLNVSVLNTQSPGESETVSAVQNLIAALQNTPNVSIANGGATFNSLDLLSYVNSHTINITVGTIFSGTEEVFGSLYVQSPSLSAIYINYSRIKSLFGPTGNGGAIYGANTVDEFIALTFMHELIHGQYNLLQGSEEQVQEVTKTLFEGLNYEQNSQC